MSQWVSEAYVDTERDRDRDAFASLVGHTIKAICPYPTYSILGPLSQGLLRSPPTLHSFHFSLGRLPGIPGLALQH